jgi:uncharacterized protein (DUF58 family)
MGKLFGNRQGKKRARGRAARNIATANVRSKRSRLGKVLAVCCVFVVFLFIALVVGTAEYKASVVGWAALLAFCIMLVASFVYSKLLARSLSVEQISNAAECKRGQVVTFAVNFKNSGPLFFFRVRAHFYVADANGNIIFDESTTLALSAFEAYDLRFDVAFEHVGSYLAGVYSVEVGDFLGLFANAIAVSAQSQINVIPQVQQIAAIELSTDALRENQRAAKTVMADSMDYSHVREYVPGDPLKTVHWKLSARGGTYMTKLFELATNPGVTIIIDFTTPECTAEEAYSLFDCIVEAAFSVDAYARQKGFESEIMFVDRDGQVRHLLSWNEDVLASVVADMPRMQAGFADTRAVELVGEQVYSRDGQNNLVVCGANFGPDVVAALLQTKQARRNPIFFAAAPKKLAGRELDKWCKPLAQLESAGIAFSVIQRSEELSGGSF